MGQSRTARKIIDWVTFALVLQHRDVSANMPVHDHSLAFVISDSVSLENGAQSILPTIQASTISRNFLSQLSAGLRHAFLLGVGVINDVCYSDDDALLFIVDKVEAFSIRRYSGEPLASTDRLTVQTANLEDLLNLQRWSALLPYNAPIAEFRRYPLSLDRPYAVQCARWLKEFGATYVAFDRWFPPRGTANDDLAHFLQQRGFLLSQDQEKQRTANVRQCI